MRTIAEAFIFTSMAAAVHAAVIVGLAGSGGLPEGAGDGGEALATLQAAPSMAATVARWTAPPVVATETPTRRSVTEPPALAVPAALAPLSAPVAPAAPEQARLSTQAASLPAIDSTPPNALPKPAAPPRPVQRASGTGQAGQQGNAPAATQVASRVIAPSASLLASWGGEIRARVEARKRRISAGRAGRVVVRITVASSGALNAATVANSSGNARLDAAAIDAVRRAQPFPAAPPGLDRSQMSFDLPIAFTR
jgi:protein TonB